MSGRLFVISGASGVGKSTVLGTVMKSNPTLRFSVSATTRAPRPGETDGVQWADFETVHEMIRARQICRIIAGQFLRQERELKKRQTAQE